MFLGVNPFHVLTELRIWILFAVAPDAHFLLLIWLAESVAKSIERAFCAVIRAPGIAVHRRAAGTEVSSALWTCESWKVRHMEL